MSKTVVRTETEPKGDAYWVLGGLYEVLASSEETGGAVTVMQMTIPANAGPPPHTHPGWECAYVLEGTVRFHVDGQTYEAGQGAFVHFPAATLETYEPTSTAKMIFVYQPGGIDKFFAEVGEPAPRREMPPPMQTPPDLERIARIGEQYGLLFQAPSP